MNDSDNRSIEVPSRLQPSLGSESIFFSDVKKVEMTKMKSALVKQLKQSLQQPLPSWSTGLGQTFLLSAVDVAEPRRVMVNSWRNVRHVFLPEFDTGKLSPIKFPHYFNNNTRPDDQHSGLPGRNEETVPGGELEPFSRESQGTTPGAGDQGSKDTVEASGFASAVTVDMHRSVGSGGSTPENSFDAFMDHITSF